MTYIHPQFHLIHTNEMLNYCYLDPNIVLSRCVAWNYCLNISQLISSPEYDLTVNWQGCLQTTWHPGPHMAGSYRVGSMTTIINELDT